MPVGKCIREVGREMGREGSSVERKGGVSKAEKERRPEGTCTQNSWSGPQMGQTRLWMCRTLEKPWDGFRLASRVGGSHRTLVVPDHGDMETTTSQNIARSNS